MCDPAICRRLPVVCLLVALASMTAEDSSAQSAHGLAFVEKLFAEAAEAGDNFGGRVAIQGDFLVTTRNSGLNAERGIGEIIVFRKTARGWVQDAAFSASNASWGDHFGACMAIDLPYLVIGAAGVNRQRGAAYVFEHDGDAWDQVAELFDEDGNPGDHFGCDVAVSGDRILVGAFQDDDTGQDSGSVFAYALRGGSWVLTEKLHPSDAGSGRAFGHSIGMSGNRAIINSRSYVDGAVHVLEYDGDWREVMRFTGKCCYFGHSVDIDGDRAVLGVSLGVEAHVLERKDGVWTRVAIQSTSQLGGSKYFGHTIALSGGNMIVGSPGGEGRAFVYSRTDDGWVETAIVDPPDNSGIRAFADQVDISGHTVVLGSPLDDEKGEDAGAVYVYELENR